MGGRYRQPGHSRRLPVPFPALLRELASTAGEAVLAGVVESVLDYPLGLLDELDEAVCIVAFVPGFNLLEDGCLVRRIRIPVPHGGYRILRRRALPEANRFRPGHSRPHIPAADQGPGEGLHAQKAVTTASTEI
jgi:hypothetical protein